MAALLAAAALLAGAAAQAAPPASALLGYNGGNNNNPHNLSSQSQNAVKAVSETQICIFCHTPHGATPQSILWNRLAPTRMGSFPLYNSTPIAIDDVGIRDTSQYKDDGSVEYPNGATKLCLSCHDGATAIGLLADGTAINMTADFITDPAKIFDPTLTPPNTEDFSRTHPVSFVYNGMVRDYINGAGGKSGYKLPTPADPLVRLDGQDRMQCTTCHNPHWNTRGAVAGYDLPFWANYSGDEAADYDATCNVCHESPPLVAFPPGGGHGL